MRQSFYPANKTAYRRDPHFRSSIHQNNQKSERQWRQTRYKSNQYTSLQPSLSSLVAESSMLINDIQLPNCSQSSPSHANQGRYSTINKGQERQNSLRVSKDIKMQRYSRCEMIRQQAEQDLKYSTNKQQAGMLRNIIQHYKRRSLERTYYDNLAQNLGIKVSNDLQARKKLVTVKGTLKEYSLRDMLYDGTAQKARYISQFQSLEVNEMFAPANMKVEAQSINQFLKSQDEKPETTLLDMTKMQGLRTKMLSTYYGKNNKSLFQKLKRQNTNQLKTNILELSDNVVAQKVNKYKEFLFLVNFSHNIYRDLDILKHESPFKIFIGKGNNNNLIRSIIKKRFWLQEVKNKNDAHIVWTQLKEDSVFRKQKQTNKETLEAVQQIEERQELFELQPDKIQAVFVATIREKTSSVHKQKQSQKNLKLNFKTMEAFQPHFRLLSVSQLQVYHGLMQRYTYKKKNLFMDRLKYLKKIKVVRQDQFSTTTIHNHLPLNGFLGNKKAMFYMLRQYHRLTDRNIFNCVPLTFHIKKPQGDEQFKAFLQWYEQNKSKKRGNYWIVKPGQFSNRGQGISCTSRVEDVQQRVDTLRRLGKNKSLIVQQYISNPLLYNGRKFDIRTYMLISTNNGVLRAYWYQDGYIRTSSYIWKLTNITDSLVHLTNDAIQKDNDDYGKFEPGNKLTYSDLQKYIETLPQTKKQKQKKFSFMNDVYPRLKNIATDAVKATFNFLDPDRKSNNFQIFGFDFMIDSSFKPWLIEINTNPCLELSCPILERIIPSMIENAFRIAVDPIFPPPMNYSQNFKYNIPENALHYNKFQLIFDEERDGPQLRLLYKDNNIVQKIDDYEQDKQIYEEQGQELDIVEK